MKMVLTFVEIADDAIGRTRIDFSHDLVAIHIEAPAQEPAPISEGEVYTVKNGLIYPGDGTVLVGF